VAMEPSPVIVAIREDLARLEAAAALGPPLDDEAMAELYPLLAAAVRHQTLRTGRAGAQDCNRADARSRYEPAHPGTSQ
jgi:hypothetical protein